MNRAQPRIAWLNTRLSSLGLPRQYDVFVFGSWLHVDDRLGHVSVGQRKLKPQLGKVVLRPVVLFLRLVLGVVVHNLLEMRFSALEAASLFFHAIAGRC